MADVREKLVEIIQNSVGGCARHWAEVIADGLIAHGVTVQESKGVEIDPFNKWISVKDRLPQGADGEYLCEDVIAYLNNGEVEAQVCPGWLRGDKWHLLVGDEDCHTSWGLGAVTHWQPMPQPPKGE